MHSRSNTRSRAKVGTVQIKVSNNRLQLVFRYGGKRYYVSTGLRDTPIGSVLDMWTRVRQRDQIHNGLQTVQ